MTVITVCGELVIDLIPARSAAADGGPPQYAAFPGGNALNVAVAAARLGNVVHLMSRVGPGPFGRLLRDHAVRSGVSPDALLPAREPVSLAVVELAADGSADYSFHTRGAADWQWTPEELSAAWPADTRIVHVGSISSWTPPGSRHIAAPGPARTRRRGPSSRWRAPSTPGTARPRPDHDPQGAPMTQQPHAHQHEHGDAAHVHTHVGHDHDHTEHEHRHQHDDVVHSHEHVHQQELTEDHAHDHG